MLQSNMNILLTGGAGYIGSHAAVVLSEAGYKVSIFDNFSNSKRSVVKRLEKILNNKISLVEGDVRDANLLIEVMKDFEIDAVMHFAGSKSVDQSTRSPLLYYDNNVVGMISLIKAMELANIKKIVFSSSATIYGLPRYLPCDESHPTEPINPYGNSKLVSEKILRDLSKSDSSWRVASLRYFNPAGAHHSGLIGDDPLGEPNNLMPFIARVINKQLPTLNVFGTDYNTRDGTGERDYIHVLDLAEAHLAALRFLNLEIGFNEFNLGTGSPVSVLEIIRSYERVVGGKIPIKYANRRPGDLPCVYASVDRAKKLLLWNAKRTLDEMCASNQHFYNTLKN